MRKAVLILSSLLFFVSFLPMAFAQPAAIRPSLSVMNLRPGAGVSGQDAVLLTNSVFTELDSLGLYDITPQAKRDQALQAAGFRATDSCDEAPCLARAGKALGVQLMVGGTVEAIESTFSVTLLLVDVETGWVDNVVVDPYTVPMDSLLASGIKQAAWELAEPQRLIINAKSLRAPESLPPVRGAREEPPTLRSTAGKN